MKVLHDEQSHGLVHNEKYCIATMNSDDFGLKSPVIQDVFEPNMYTYIISVSYTHLTLPTILLV